MKHVARRKHKSPKHLQGSAFVLAHRYKSSATGPARVTAGNMAAWVPLAMLLAASQTTGRSIPPGDSQRVHYSSQATALYNAESNGEAVYKFLGVPPEEESRDSEVMTFIIKETICSKSAEKDEICPFKEDGVVKICRTSLPGQEGKRPDVSCQDTNTTVKALSNGENMKSHHVLKLLKSGKKKVETNFRQFDNQGALGSHAASCVTCIFDMFNRNRDSSISGQ